MTKRLTPYGSSDQTNNVAKVGKSKTPPSLVARMPSPEIAAKVGPSKVPAPPSLAARMPSPEIAAKVGMSAIKRADSRRVIRRNARG